MFNISLKCQSHMSASTESVHTLRWACSVSGQDCPPTLCGLSGQVLRLSKFVIVAALHGRILPRASLSFRRSLHCWLECSADVDACSTCTPLNHWRPQNSRRCFRLSGCRR